MFAGSPSQLFSDRVGCRSYHRLPAQQHFGLADVGSSPLGVVLGLREELDLTAAHCVHVKTDSQAFIYSEKRIKFAPGCDKKKKKIQVEPNKP